MHFHLITIFPDIFSSYLNHSILKRALDNNSIKISIYNLRSWTKDKHKTIDDTPYGGGAGMIMKIEPLHKAISDVSKKIKGNKKIVLLSAKGKKWNQQEAKKYSNLEEIILICGRYEGVDERITNFIEEEISIGDYVLTGGELPALILIDSIIRFIPGVLGNLKSTEEESHTKPGELEYPQYTRPEIFKVGSKKYPVPQVLLSGNHQKIAKWRKKQSKKINDSIL